MKGDGALVKGEVSCRRFVMEMELDACVAYRVESYRYTSVIICMYAPQHRDGCVCSSMTGFQTTAQEVSPAKN